MVKINAQTPVFRSYNAVLDLVSVAICGNRSGGWGTKVPHPQIAYLLSPDLPQITCLDSGGEVVEMEQVAQTVLKALGDSNIEIERDWNPNASRNQYVGNGQALERLGKKLHIPFQSFPTQVSATVSYLKELWQL